MELQERITALPTKKDRGDAFEVFAEAYLATQPSQQAKLVWPFSSIPHHIKQQLALGTMADMGVDGIFQTHLDQFAAYQVKFRTDRTMLTWREVSTFLGLADKFERRVLLTNVDDLPNVLDERSGFNCIRGSDLDQLEERHFKQILAWLEGSYVPKEEKEPLPHQTEALENIIPALERHDRVTTVMACGTGKTLVALWTAERLKCKNVLVLVPALALLRQTLHEWLDETSWERVSYLCVCSDPTVEKDPDGLIVRQSDLDFPVSTDSETVKEFLSQEFDGVKIVFSTYQSARVVAAGMDKSSPFDLGILDEAHKTAGKEGANFSFALKNENLPLSKRLFMTATPRHYDVRHKDKEGDSRLVYSMDVPEVYGPIVHKLAFAEAAQRNIICDYKVIISVITSDMVNAELLQRGEVLVDGDPIKAQHVANQIALQKAVETYDVRKIFTFHRTVESAKAFTGTGSRGISNHLPTFATYHVSGAMNTAFRESLMKEFREAETALMSNARCLTEGINVPAVDMVAFLSPKRSRVDIVQATGRAMRKDEAKTIGYVLVPLFLQQSSGESIEEAVQRGNFDEVWNVLQAMQEQDDVLAETIRQLREERGRTGRYDDARFFQKVEFLGPELSLEVLREEITTRIIERLGSTWDERYGQMQKFKERYGHCVVPSNWPEDPVLERWVSTQRQFKKNGKLDDNRIRRLDEIGFVWDLREAKWKEMIWALTDYKSRYGNCNVPVDWAEDPKLATWVVTRRVGRKQGWLTDYQVWKLDKIGFIWDPYDQYWQEMLSELNAYKNEHGHCKVPDVCPENPKLANWVSNQRNLYKHGRLSNERINLLEKTGFDWNVIDYYWEQMFSDLLEFRKQYGHCRVPQGWLTNKSLAIWVTTQRQGRKNGRLSNEKIQRLEGIGFSWDPSESDWENMFSKLVQFKTEHNHCNVPAKYPKDLRLGKWVDHQRNFYRRNSLSKERIVRLEKMGFVWDQLETEWKSRFEELLAYKRKHGHCNVPQKWKENPKLASWVGTQRLAWKKGKLSQERIKRLEEIGFQWEIIKR
jgi:superfamily II DNA or RNA helicase